MKNDDYKYLHDSKTLYDFDWEQTLLQHLRSTIEIKRLVVKTDDEVVLFDGAPNDLPHELLLRKRVRNGESAFANGFDTLALETVYVADEEAPSYLDLATCCTEKNERLSWMADNHEYDRRVVDERVEIVGSLLKLAMKRCGHSWSVRNLIYDIASALDIKLDGPIREEFDSYYED